ncbi:MAG TPA: hypothetical protein VKY31_01600 [Terriglobia bacterium]|nr:hypothetical protein [Terriglobia bacterium]
MAQDLSKYRDFQFGMTLDSVARQTQMKTTQAKTLHERPAVIQTLEWNQVGYAAPGTKNTSVRSIRFDFYNGELWKMLVTYNPAETNGLTANDIIDAISGAYGTATTPGDSVSVSNFTGYEDQEKVLARWDNSQYSYNLYRSSYGNTFGLVAFSKTVEVLAHNASHEADRLDNLEAPARELAQKNKQADEARAEQEAARTVNKPKFHP